MRILRLTSLGKIIFILLICAALSRLISDKKLFQGPSSGLAEPPPDGQNKLIITVNNNGKFINNYSKSYESNK